MDYDPNVSGSRRHLATLITTMLGQAGFMEEWHEGHGSDPTREKVYYRPVDGIPNMRVVVYTSIVDGAEGPEVREVGKDACRVLVMYKSEKDGDERAIAKATRVHRTGDTDAICGRLLGRMREVYAKALKPGRCEKCGAPTFISKKGNDVCAETCWTTEVRQKPASNYGYRGGYSSYRRW